MKWREIHEIVKGINNYTSRAHIYMYRINAASVLVSSSSQCFVFLPIPLLVFLAFLFPYS